MYGEIHILTGIAFQQAGGIGWGLPAAMMSHWALDDLNMGQYSIQHSLGHGWQRSVILAARACVWVLLLTYLWFNPRYLVCGLAAWLCCDIQWVVKFLFHYDLRIHERMYPAWLKSQWGMLVCLIISIVLLGVATS